MSAQNAADRVFDGFVGVLAFYQHGVGVGGRIFSQCSCWLDISVYIEGCVLSGHRRFPGGQANLPLGHGETGKGVHHQEHIAALAGEVLGVVDAYVRSFARNMAD